MIKQFKLGYLITMLMLILAGCSTNSENGADTASNANNATDHSTHQNAATSQEPADEEPVQGEAEPVVYTLEASIEEKDGKVVILVDTNLTMSEENYGKAHVDGQGHIHFYNNGGLIGPILVAEYEVNRALLKDGENKIKLVLAQNNHAESYGATKELSFTK